MNNIQQYFDISYSFENNIPKFKIKLRQSFIESKKYPLNKNGMPLSPSSIEYFNYFLGENIGKIAYEFYKKFFNKKFAFYFIKTNFGLKENEEIILNEYFNSIDLKMKNNHKKVIDSIEYRNKLKQSYNHDLQKKIKKEYFSNPENKKKMVEACHNEQSKQKRLVSYKKWLENGGYEKIKEAANKEDRKEKISIASKKMWEKFLSEGPKGENNQKLKNMLNNSYSKKYNFNNKKMNKIEFIVASLLAELKIKFEYEKLLTVNDKKIYYPDFIIDDKKIIIECFGDFWHGNPKFYKNNQLLFEDLKVSDIHKKDNKRLLDFKNAGYKTLVFWENEILNNIGEVKQKVKEAFNV